jgi:hypothetical protein
MRKTALASLLLVAGCVAPGPGPANVEAVRAVPRQSAATAAPLATGESQLTIRAVSRDDPGQEYVGATCIAETPWSRTEVTAPVLLLMPDYGAASPNVTVTCRSGKLTGTAVAVPEAAWSGGLAGWPAVGVSVGTGNSGGVGVGFGWWGGGAGTQSGVPVTRYHELRVPLA